MRSFLEKTEWYNLIPRFDNREYFVPANNVYFAYASNESNSEKIGFTATKYGTFYIGSRPQGTDMAVVIRAAE